jgi:4-hydroxy-tetrahydrodipicolinate synthase
MSKIKGIYAASMSIFNNDLSLNIKKTVEHAEKLIDQGCHGVALLGSTGQAQLISVAEKISLLNYISTSKYKDKYLIGTGLNSLTETINLMKIASSLNLNNFLVECVKELARNFPEQIVGVKDSSYNLYEKLKIENFSVMPGSELKLLKGLELGCSGIITATCNVTAKLSRQVYEDFFKKKSQTSNEILCNVRSVFDQFNLISGLHSFMSEEDSIYKNVLPPLSLLSEKDKKKLTNDLNKLNFKLGSLEAA